MHGHGPAGPRVQFLDGGDLRRGQAGVGLRAFAQQARGLEQAGRRIVHHAVFDAVLRITLGEGRRLDGRHLRGRDVGGGIRLRGLPVEDGLGQEMREVVGGRARDDAVVVLRETLGLHEGLPPAVRAAMEIRALHGPAVEGGRDRLARHRHLVDGAVTEVDDLLGVPERPGRVRRSPAVPGVGGCGRVAEAHGPGQAPQVEVTRESAVAGPLELAVPSRRRKPDLELDVRIRRRLDLSRDPAESGHLGGRTLRHRHGSRGHGLRARDGGGSHRPAVVAAGCGKGELGQALAGCARRRRGGERQKEQERHGGDHGRYLPPRRGDCRRQRIP